MAHPRQMDSTWHRIRYDWSGKIALLIVFGCLALVLVALQSGPSSNVEGRILRIGSSPDGFGHDPVLTVELPDGTIQTVLIEAPYVADCNVGSKIVLIKRRLRYSAYPPGC